MSFSQAQNCQTITRLFLFINMLNADETRLHIVTNSSTLATKVTTLVSCIVRLNDWLLQNGLHLNPSKSEANAFFNPRSKPLATLAESIKLIYVVGSPIKLQSSVKRLGVHLDSKKYSDKHVSEVCRASYFHIRTLCHIRISLITDAAKIVASAIVGSRLDYCNSLLAGTSVQNLSRLQLVQNTLAHVVAQKPCYCHITSVLIDRHRLPVRQRMEFKIATPAFKVFATNSLLTLLKFSQDTLLHGRFNLLLLLPSLCL